MSKTFFKYFTMFLLPVDHIVWLYINPSGDFWWLYFISKAIGKIFFPFFLLFLAEGFQYTSSRTRYRRRLLIFALVSQVPYWLALHYSPNHPGNMCDTLNMGFTLYLSCWMLTIYEIVRNKPLKWTLMLLCAALTAFSNHPVYGAVLTLIFYRYRDDRSRQAAGIAILALLITLFRVLWFKLSGSDAGWHIIFYFSGIILAIPLLLLYNGKIVRPEGRYARWVDRWVFYIFYPLHFAIFAAVNFIMY